MRGLAEATQAWVTVQRYESLDDLRNAVRLDGSDTKSPAVLRSVCWKAFLFFESIDHDVWIPSITAARAAYEALRTRFNGIDDHDKLGDNPLADGVEVHWNAVQDDENLRAEILQDLIRLPDDEYLRHPDTQSTMLSILYVYCKLNPDLSYRQGMHELLAPIMMVLEHDALTPDGHTESQSTDALLIKLLDAAYIEHDAFILFSRIMQSAKSFYEQTNHHAAENPLILRSKRITEDYLSIADSQLSRHLQRLGIPPQLYLMRWVRLLFGREFDRMELPGLWDVLFAEDPSLDLVDHICVVMLLRLRWELLEADYNGALSLLLRYSAGQTQAKALAIEALHLRDRLTTASGRRLIMKYTGRDPHESGRRSLTPPAMQRNITAMSGVGALKNAFRSSSDGPGQTEITSIESLLQNTARNIYNKGEQLGIGKAVRSAVDDIHRRAQQVRDSDALSPRLKSPRQRPRGSSRLVELERRNQQLATLLEHSTAHLWDVQKTLAESEQNAAGLDLEALSVAIGKVQFVQLHLQDPTLRLDGRDTVADQQDLSSQQSGMALLMNVESSTEGHVVRAETVDTSSTGTPSAPASGLPDASERHLSAHQQADQLHRLRPSLSESSYSWMLGQQSEEVPKQRLERPDTLFGS